MPSWSARAFGACGAALAVLVAAGPARPQSAADLSARLAIDGRSDDFTPVEAAFRNAEVCASIVPPVPCGADEERADDSAWSVLQDVHQIHVTWDAERLYVAADAVLGGHALLLLLDYEPGGLASLSQLGSWRRAVEFGPEMRPEAFLAVRDAGPAPELWRAAGEHTATRVAASEYRAAASFDAEAPGRALEAAIPWAVLFPDAPRGLDTEPGAPGEPMFVLPPEASRLGLRLAALVVHAADGFGAADVAPDNTAGVALEPRAPVGVDRAVRVDWDAAHSGPPHFVDFGVAIETQAAPRFVPAAPAAATPLRLDNLRTFAGTTPSRLLLADAGSDLVFAFDVAPPAPARIYVTASICSLGGQRTIDLYRDAGREPATPPPPLSPFGDPARDRWNGRDTAGAPVPGGIYVLVLRGGLAPGNPSAEVRRAITVVR